MEGITYWPFRQALNRCFPGCGVYYTPFIAATSTHSFKTREKKEIDPANNEGLHVIPQILTNDAGAFLWAAGRIGVSGYREVNFILGCPSPTVVTHGKGAGFLADTGKLDRFFDAVFSGMGQEMKISVKTRIGMESEDEAESLMEVFNRYPISKLIVHPRLRKDFYKGEVRLHVFEKICALTEIPVIFNGDVFTPEDAWRIAAAFPGISGIMIGRGALMNPSLFRELAGGEPASEAELKEFHDTLLELWQLDIPDFSGVIGKMKELLYYLGPSFANSAGAMKKIRKSRRKEEYLAAAEELFTNCRLLPRDERTWRP